MLVVGVYFAVLAAVGGPSEWAHLGVPPVSPPFADMRSVTSAWECDRQGIDVLRRNPCDPHSQRPANYPRVWLLPSSTGLGRGSTIWLGTVTGVAFLLAALAVLPLGARPGDAVLYGLLVCSPAVMLGVERGNVDLLLFALLVTAVLLLQRGLVARVGGYAAILLAAVLKLFPIFAAVLFLRRRRREKLVAGGAVVLGFAAYALFTLADIRTIAEVVPQHTQMSYGIARITPWLVGALDGPPSVLEVRLGLDPERAVGLALAGAVALGALAARRLRLVRAADDRPLGGDAHRDLDFFWAGAGIFAGSYVLALNWDYRLVFTLLTVPLLVRWLRARRPLAFVTATALAAVLWLDSHEYWLPLEVPALTTVVSVAQFVLFACYVAALAATAPLWRSRPAAAAG